VKLAAQWIDGDEAALERARAFVAAKWLDRSPLQASLEQDVIREHSRLREVGLAERTVGLAAVLEGVHPWRSVPVDASLPGAAIAALDGIERPFTAAAGEPLWSELQRAGGREQSSEIQLARLRHDPLPEPDRRVVTLEKPDALREYGVEIAAAHFRAGPFVALRDDDGRFVSWGGVEFVTDRVAQLAYAGTREDRRGEDGLRAVVAELVRRLETDTRTVVLRARALERAAIALYGGLGFRGRRRIATFEFA
jgi:ribosomal protein S18 acetylase RimI-like enzyme